MLARDCFAADKARYGGTWRAWLQRPFLAIAVYRFGQYLREPGGPQRALRPLYTPLALVVSMLTGIEIGRGATIGPGLMLLHGFGTVIHSDSTIGADCSIMQGVTIGRRNDTSVPVIGDRVEIGAAAQILGGITIGPDARIGALSLVIHDVPAGATVAGIPARELQRTAMLRETS